MAVVRPPGCGSGWFVEPTIFEGVSNQMRIAQEEVFGPVLSVIPFRDEEEAIALATTWCMVWPRVCGRRTCAVRC